MQHPQRFLVTSALPYANGPLHIGHLAGAYLASDAYVRFLRLMGKDVVHVCGSDEHGAAITMKAVLEDTTPQAIVDHYHEMIKAAFVGMGVSFDIYHRTSASIHHETSQGFFRDLYAKGQFIEKESEQYYDEEAGQFLADRYIVGTCPNCGNEEAYGDQCEKCGSTLSPEELIAPVSKLSGTVPVKKKTKHWYLPLDAYSDWLKEWLNQGTLEGKELHDPTTWKNHVLGQCNSWIENGLKPRSMTRDLDWGIDVPEEIEGAEGKKLYVWLDAPIGYISATKQWAKDHGKSWEPYWQDEHTQLVHFIGKDNIVFHCLIFPSILKMHGEYILPFNVPANQFMNLEGRKLSTSKNWAVWVHEYLQDFPDQQDVLRYHLVKNMPEKKDSEFTWKSFQDSNNNELVANLANFINRVLVLTHKYYDGIVPDFDPNEGIESAFESGEFAYHDSEMLAVHDLVQAYSDDIRSFEFREALKKVMELSSLGNQLLQYNEPWKQQKENPELVKVVMNAGIQIVAMLAYVTRPFLPFTSDRICKFLGIECKDQGELEHALTVIAEGELLVPSGQKLLKPEHLFSRIPDEEIQAQLDKLYANQPESASNHDDLEAIKPTIDFQQFAGLDLRIGKILEAQAVPKADRLLNLTVDIGLEKRTILSGIAQHFSLEELKDKKVVVVANLAPKKMRGIESNGMILLAEDAEGKLDFVIPERAGNPGEVVK